MLSELDRFGSVYLVNKVNEIVKYDLSDAQFGYYSNNSLGAIGYVDVTNPLKITVFYPSFYTVVFLDRQLRETGTVDMLQLGLGEIRTVATATNGALWIFDFNEQILKNIDAQGHVLLQSPDLRLTLGQTLDLTKMKQWGDNLYALSRSGSLLMFDLFGYYQQELATNVSDFQLVGDRVFVVKESNIEEVGGASVLLSDQHRPQTDRKVLLGSGENVVVEDGGYKRFKQE